MEGGIYLWKDGREVPDTVSVTLQQPEEILISWVSGVRQQSARRQRRCAGNARNHLARQPGALRSAKGRTGRRACEMTGRSAHTPQAHMQNFFDCIRSGKEPNCPFDLGYRVSVACRMAVDSYRLGRTLRWDAAREEIV